MIQQYENTHIVYLTNADPDVIELSSGDEDALQISSESADEDADGTAGSEESSGAHINDALNLPDAQGRVLVNINHPAEEKDIYLAPQLARAVKPHQVCPTISFSHEISKQQQEPTVQLVVSQTFLLSSHRSGESGFSMITSLSLWSGIRQAVALAASLPTAWDWAKHCRSFPSLTSC